LAFIGAKGGLGTTTTALNVAAALATPDKTCIAIELRGYRGTFSLSLAHRPAGNLSGIRDMPPQAVTPAVIGELLADGYANLRVLHGPQRIEEFGDLTSQQAEAVLDSAAQLADYVVVDLPPHPCPMCETAVGKATFTTLLLDRDLLTVALGQGSLTLLRSWGARDPWIGGLVVNRSSQCDGMSLKEMGSMLGCSLLGMVPSDPGRTPGYHNNLPVTITRSETLMAGCIRDLSEKLASAKSRVLQL
jgi:Flp pilus assembly CpaE family ATPase